MKRSHFAILGLAGGASLLAATSIAFAQTSSSVAPVAIDPAACSAALDTQQSAVLPAMDALTAAQKSTYQARVTALKAALALTDTAQRQAAIQAAEKAFQQANSDAMKAFGTALQAASKAFQASCPGLRSAGSFGGKGKMGIAPVRGSNPEKSGLSNKGGGKGRGHTGGQGIGK